MRNYNVYLINSLNNMENSLGYFSAEQAIEPILKPTIRSENLYEIFNDNGVRVVNFSHPKF
jgi:hypothetical protein